MLSNFRSRLVLSNLLLTLLGLLVVGAVFTRVLADRNRAVKESDLAADARLLATQVESLYQRHVSPHDQASAEDQRSELSKIVADSSKTLKVRVVIVSPTGNIVRDSQSVTPYDRGTWHPLDRQALRRAETAKRELLSGDKVLLQSPIHGTVQANGGAVQLVANIGDVRPGIGALGNVILTFVGTALLVWLLIGLYFTYSISRPLLMITAATERMAEGAYNTRVPARGDGEIARLATSFNAMARQIEQSDSVLKDFVANVSHDLRTPLTMITGFSQALLDGTAGPDEVDDSAQVIHEEAVKMQRLVEDLLQLTRLESGLLKFQHGPVDVRLFVQSVIERTRRAHGGKSVSTLINDVPVGVPQIQIDREHFERALRNLLDNALQYTPADGSVSVTARAIGRGWVEIGVTDTGVGIPAAAVGRIFERFYRTDKARERSHGHSGLGLAIVREIVESHGGHVSVASVEGQGTTFSITAPQVRQAAAGVPASPSREPVTHEL